MSGGEKPPLLEFTYEDKIMKNIIGYTGIAMVRAGMIICIIKLALLWSPVLSNNSLSAVIERAFIG